MYINFLFIISGLLLAILFITRSKIINFLNDSMKTSAFIAFMTATMFIYVLFALALTFILPGIINKIIMLLFGLSPFIIGKYATYSKLKFYSFIQITCILISVCYVFLV